MPPCLARCLSVRGHQEGGREQGDLDYPSHEGRVYQSGRGRLGAPGKTERDRWRSGGRAAKVPGMWLWDPEVSQHASAVTNSMERKATSRPQSTLTGGQHWFSGRASS